MALFHWLTHHFCDELAVRRQRFRADAIAARDAFEERADVFCGHVVGEGRPTPGHDPLADHHLPPAVVEEELFLLTDEQAGVAEKLDLPASSLSFHLAHHTRAGLITQRRESRSLIYAADYDIMNALVGFLTENCCGGRSCAPAAARTPKRKSA